MKILIISGFLGAGKTTFIKELSKKTGKDFCILENEYAQVDIDKVLLSQDENLNIWELTENCICCSGKQDFATSILTIANTIDPEFLIVEPTGVAKLSSIVQNIKQISYEKISILEPITIVDVNNFTTLKNKYGDIFADQIANAGQIIFSKGESLESDYLNRAKNELSKFCESCKIICEHYSSLQNEWWQKLLHTDISGNVIQINQEESCNFEELSLKDVALKTPVHLISFLEMITFGVFGKIYRAKGFLPCGDLWLKFDIVDTTYQISESEQKKDAQVAFIGNNLLRSDIRRLLLKKNDFVNIKKSRTNGEKQKLGRSF